MRIEDITHEPYDGNVIPGIIFNVFIKYSKGTDAIISLNGQLCTDDGKIVGNLIEDTANDEPRENQIGAKGTSKDQQFKEGVLKKRMICLLNKESLKYIEMKRLENRKRDVVLTISLAVKYLRSNAKICTTLPVKPKTLGLKDIPNSYNNEDPKLLSYAYIPTINISQNYLWILSGDAGPFFLNMKEETFNYPLTIHGSDWIHDYLPKLGVGSFFIIEIPRGKQTLKKAWEYIEKAEECFRQWDTKGEYANCREVGKLLSKMIKSKFNGSPVIKKWKQAIAEFNKSASSDLHEEDIEKQKPFGKIKIGFAEGEYILIITQALIKYAEELLEEEP